MSGTSHHIIRQQYLHVEVNGTESDGLALQRSLPGLCRDWLTPAIERVLERGSPPEGHLCIERLEIDAGTLTLERLEHALAESVAQALEKALREQTLPPTEPSPTIISGNIQHKTAEHSINEAFIYFLKTGSLPWSFRLPAGSTLEQVVLRSWTEQAKPDLNRLVNEAMLRVLASETVQKRLIRQFSPAFLENLLTLLSPEDQKITDGVLETLHRSAVPSVELKLFERHLWKAAFAMVAKGKPFTSMDHLVSEAWRSLPVMTVAYTALARVVQRHWPGITNKASATMNNRDLIPSNLPGSEKTPINPSEHPDAREGIYIENAGLILLHPFLPRCFGALGIAAEDQLLQPERALCLLHFLTTGQLIAPEYELILPKILCNVPLEAPAESDVTLTAAEQEEGVAMLEAVIRHWEALRNTSPDGLRGTFLLRPGKVSLRDDGDWLLQVESNTFDILLDQLPWGISMIKLPWMDNMLWLEWR